MPGIGATTTVTEGSPRVMVPVLSRTTAVDALRELERRAVADEDAVLGALAGADHDRRRRGEAHRARAGNDQHRDRARQGIGEARLGAEQSQPRRSAPRSPMTSRHEPPRDPVGDPLDRRLRALRSFDERDDLGERRVPADPLARMTNEPLALIVAPIDPSPATLSTGRDSPVSIDSSTDERAVDQDAVDRDPVAGSHAHEVTDHHFGHRHVHARRRAAARARCPAAAS